MQSKKRIEKTEEKRDNTNWGHATPKAVAKAPVELSLFMYNEGEPDSETLIYFDPEGKRYEKRIRKELIQAALKALTHKGPKVVPRSTGGLISARPVKLVLYSTLLNYPYVEPEIRIRVRFKDYRPSLGNLNHGKFVEMTKDVLPHEVMEGFKPGISNRYMVDLGQGVIPVHVYAFEKNAAGEPVALFLDLEKVEQIKRGALKEEMVLQRYVAPLDGLRIARETLETSHVESDFHRARKNLKRILAGSLPPYPKSVETGTPLNVTAGTSFKDLKKILEDAPWSGTTDSDENTFTNVTDVTSYMVGI